jgi:outer membrane protein OmpA-like peptidoglycan-associated protein
MNAKSCLVLFVCFLALCLVGCKSEQKTARGPLPPVSEAKQVYPAPQEQRPTAQADAERRAVQKPAATQSSMQSVYFGSDKYRITPQATENLKKDAELLKQNPTMKVEISGNADTRASTQYNQKLAQKRADAVKQQLVKQGVNPEQLQVKSYGEARPICGENTESCHASNRRVDLKAIG